MPIRAVSGYLLLLISVTVTACSGSSAGIETGGPPSSEVVSELLREIVDDASRFSGADLVARLGEPVRSRADAGPSGSDSLRTMMYHGLEFILHESGSSRPVLVGMALTDPRYTSPEGLRVGYVRENIRRTLGMPSESTEDRLVYRHEAPSPVTLIILLEDRASSRIEWVLAE